MLLHLAETEATLDALRDELDGFDPSQKGSSKIIATKQRDLDIQREKYGDVLIALHLSGTEIARAMVSRKMYVDKSDFTPKRIIARMERASPTGKVGKETQQKATEIGNKLQDVQSKIQKKTEQKQKRSDSNKKKRAGKAVSKQSDIAKGEQKVRSRKRVNKAKAFLADNGFCV
jgi:DNA repair ATPase RecN